MAETGDLEGKGIVVEGFNFSFIHPYVRTCKKGRKRDKIVMPIYNPIFILAVTEAKQNSPTCDDCGTPYEYGKNEGSFGKWINSANT